MSVTGDDDHLVVVPRVLHRIWFGSPIPDHAEDYWAAWSRLHPGWQLVTWREGDLPPLRNQDLYDAAPDLTSGNIWQFRSDVVRYELLAEHGGVYVDCDLEPLRPVGTLIAGAGSFAAWEEQDRWIANGFMGATPDHPFIRRLIDELPGSVNAHRGHRPARISGPQYLTRMYRQHGGLDFVLPQHLIYPYSYRDVEQYGRTRPNQFETYTVHHWDNRRRERQLT